MKASVNQQETFELKNHNGRLFLNGEVYMADISELSAGLYHLIQPSGTCHQAEVLELNAEEKLVTVLVNSNTYTVSLKDQYDELLVGLGMDLSASKKMNELRSPMPGLVINLPVSVGETVEKGDVLVVLEAMKMENSIKAAAEGVVKAIRVNVKDTVEKNQVLITFN